MTTNTPNHKHSADIVLLSNKVYTGLNEEPEALAIACAQERIIAVGSYSQIEQLIDEHTQLIDYGDALIIPGLHDSHLHFFHSALFNSSLALAYAGSSEEDCVRKALEFAQDKNEDDWILMQGWREYRWNPAVLPSKHSLDKAFPKRPVALYSGDAHTLWLNSKALELLGLDRNSVAPAGGSYDRDEQGELTGIVREAAAMQLMPTIVGSFSDNQIKEAYKLFMKTCNEQGITAVCDMSLMAAPGLDFVREDIYKQLDEEHALSLRVSMFPTLLEDKSRFERMKEEFSSEYVQVRGFKQFFDGVSSQHTAYLKEPYTNARFEGDRGSTTVEPSQMRDLVLSAAKLGYPVRIHTIGDEAIHCALDIIEEANELYGKPVYSSHCLEHLENFQEEDIARLAQLGVIAAVQPCHITLDPGGPERDLGPARVPFMWPFKTLLESGAVLAFGTDAPVTPVTSTNVIYTAITRQDPKTHLPQGGWLPTEKLSCKETLDAYTQGSARSCGRLHDIGTLEPGKLADIAVFDTDFFNCKPEEIQEAHCLACYVGGVQRI